jgi:tRNA(Arg) A34 adenosine deaminase TadA
MSFNDEHFMRIAIQQAALARRNGDVPFGAVVVQGGQIIVAAPNSEQFDIDVTSHAEAKAISLACRALGRRDLSDCTLYSSNELCPMCAGAAFIACIPRIVYALSRDDLPHLFRPRSIRLAELAADTQHAPEIIPGVLRHEALPLWNSIDAPFRVDPKFVTLIKQ